jgi:1-acyl-sn-glycerol-3-phosphate acyltransferase
MKYFRKFIQIIYCVYALLWFIVLMFLVLPFIILFSMFGIKGGNLVYVVCNIWARMWYGLIGVRHEEIYEVPHDKNKNYIFVANHCSYMDIPAIVRCMHQPIRVLGKSEMVKFPVFGWIYRTAVIQVERSSVEKRARSVRALKAALKRHISIFIFPEGTFNQTNEPLKNFYDGAFRIALETQTPIKPLLFVDTLERFHWRSIFTLTPGKSRVVYMKEISVDNYKVKELDQLKKYVHDEMEKGLQRYWKYKTAKAGD